MSAAAPIAIVAVLPEEAWALRRRLAGPERCDGAARPAVRGRLGGVPVVVEVTGYGAAAATRGASRVLAATGARALIAIGFGGALDPALRPVEVVVAADVQRSGAPTLRPSGDWVDLARRAGATPGRVVSVERLVGAAVLKSQLRREHALEMPAIVDLESWAVADAARRAGVPWLVLRAVSDAHHEDLPPFLLASEQSDGTLRRAAVAWGALRARGGVSTLLALRRRARRCAEALASVAEAMCLRSRELRE